MREALAALGTEHKKAGHTRACARLQAGGYSDWRVSVRYPIAEGFAGGSGAVVTGIGMYFLVIVCGLLCSLGAASFVAATEFAPTIGDCKRHFAQDLARQQLCLRHAINAPATPLPTAPQNQSSAMVDPLRQLQLIFGFYDPRFASYNGGQEHLGLDLSAAAGTPVYAICSGRVAANKTDRPDIVAAVLVVEHDCPQPLGRVYAYYGHIRSELQHGDGVAAGDTIGAVREWPGNGHLHLGLNRQFVDENWGFVAKGASLQALREQGWLDPLNYFAPAAAGNGLKRVAPQPAVNRQNRTGNVTGKRRR